MANPSSCTVITAGQVNQALATNPTAILGPIAETSLPNAPWLTALDTGTFPAGVANTLQAVTQAIPDLGTNFAAPTFQAFNSTCGSCNINLAQSGSFTYNYNAGVFSGASTPICLTAGFNSFEGALISQLRMIGNTVKTLINGDVQNQMFLNAGVVCVAQIGVPITSMIFGGMYQYQLMTNTPPAIAATAPASFSLVNEVNGYAKTVLWLQGYESGNARLIAGYGLLELIRNELGGQASTTQVNVVPLGQLAAGGNKTAWDALLNFAFTPIMRGVEYAEIDQPLRLNFSGGTYTQVNPFVSTTPTTGGSVLTNSSAYELASHEVMFLLYKFMGMTAFKREMPENYTGEGQIKFMNQAFNGDIRFVTRDLGVANIYQDFGVLAYRIGRAYRPQIPWAVIPIIVKRCLAPTLAGCSGVSIT